jgi:ADP-ribose pyrophosphatase YjhB (NUDIX family)
MTNVIDVTVAAVIERDQRFLLVEEQANGEIVFNQPAGHLEPGESLIEAVVREAREETGFAFEPTGVLGVYLWQCRQAGRSFLRVAFCGSAQEPQHMPELDSVIVATHWLTRQQMQSLNLRSPMVLRCIDDYTAGIRFPLSALRSLGAGELAL